MKSIKAVRSVEILALFSVEMPFSPQLAQIVNANPNWHVVDFEQERNFIVYKLRNKSSSRPLTIWYSTDSNPPRGFSLTGTGKVFLLVLFFMPLYYWPLYLLAGLGFHWSSALILVFLILWLASGVFLYFAENSREKRQFQISKAFLGVLLILEYVLAIYFYQVTWGISGDAGWAILIGFYAIFFVVVNNDAIRHLKSIRRIILKEDVRDYFYNLIDAGKIDEMQSQKCECFAKELIDYVVKFITDATPARCTLYYTYKLGADSPDALDLARKMFGKMGFTQKALENLWASTSQHDIDQLIQFWEGESDARKQVVFHILGEINAICDCIDMLEHFRGSYWIENFAPDLISILALMTGSDIFDNITFDRLEAFKDEKLEFEPNLAPGDVGVPYPPAFAHLVPIIKSILPHHWTVLTWQSSASENLYGYLKAGKPDWPSSKEVINTCFPFWWCEICESFDTAIRDCRRKKECTEKLLQLTPLSHLLASIQYYPSIYGFDPATEVKAGDPLEGIRSDLKYYARDIDLERDIRLSLVGIKLRVLTAFTAWVNRRRTIWNRLQFVQGDRNLGDISCIHTVISSINAEALTDILANGEDSWALSDEVASRASTATSEIQLPPEMHFVALYSYSKAIAEVGIGEMLRASFASDTLNPFVQQFGFNSAMHAQVMRVLINAVPDVADEYLVELLEFLEENVPADWLISHKDYLWETYNLQFFLEERPNTWDAIQHLFPKV